MYNRSRVYVVRRETSWNGEPRTVFIIIFFCVRQVYSYKNVRHVQVRRYG